MQRLEMKSVTATDLASRSESRRSEAKESTIREPKATPKKDHDWECRDQRHGLLQQSFLCGLAGLVLDMDMCGYRRYHFDQTSQGGHATAVFDDRKLLAKIIVCVAFDTAPPHLERHRFWKSKQTTITCWFSKWRITASVSYHKKPWTTIHDPYDKINGLGWFLAGRA